jgi:Paired amphipathic helix repeat
MIIPEEFVNGAPSQVPQSRDRHSPGEELCGYRQNVRVSPSGDIVRPTVHDVICGEGGEASNHEGNRRYLELVEANKENYGKVPEGTKKLLSPMVVQWVNSGGHIHNTNTAYWKIPSHQQEAPRPHVGRFIKKSTVNGLWYEIDYHEACSLVLQAFREGSDEVQDCNLVIPAALKKRLVQKRWHTSDEESRSMKKPRADLASVADSKAVSSPAIKGESSTETQAQEVLPIADALVYLQQVQQAFHDQMEKYDEFLALVKKIKEAHSVEAAVKDSLLVKVVTLFQGHKNLAVGFKAFLREDDRVQFSKILAQELLNEAALDLANLLA